MMPDKTLFFKGEAYHVVKKSKERLNVLLCCNTDGFKKLPHFAIVKTRNPLCFKNVQKSAM